jgi:hypothetical protein
MTPNKEIEDQFTSAVKSALDAASGAILQPFGADSMPAQADEPESRGVWRIVLLSLASAAIATVVAAAVLLYFGRDNLAQMTAEMAQIWPGGASVRPPEATVATSGGTAGSGLTAAAPNSAAALSASTVEPPPAAAAPAFERLAALSPRTPMVPAIGNPASTASIAAKPRRPASAAAGRPRRLKLARSRPSPAAPSKQASLLPPQKGGAGAGAPAPMRSIVVSSIDHMVYWAFEPAGKIFRSTDRKNWQQQDSGVRNDLFAGQAVSSTVCWAVGRDGTILLTTDGKRWQRIRSPTNENLVGVSAASADVAEIVTTDGSHFATLDRGSNWQPN